MKNNLSAFLKSDSIGGILLILTMILALLSVNSPLSELYESFLHIPMEIRVGSLYIDKTLHHWINDGLMAIFFLIVGLEVKREVMIGHLSSLSQIALPAIAAVGGIVAPALIYLYFNHADPVAMSGWAIPTATDIAFALGMISLLGKRVPVSLKVFLMALAIIDDLGAIIIIALFYTTDLSMISIYTASASLFVLILLNIFGVSRKSIYLVVGLVLWVSVLKSGVHATLAGVALAFTIPMIGHKKDATPFSPLKEIEHALHPWITFFILPLFAFVNAGIDLRQLSVEQIAGPVPMGIAIALFVGKQLGVFTFSWLAIKLKITKLPEGSSWLMLYGVSLLTGIGFTMSLFIDSLAFADDAIFAYTDKLAILAGTFASATMGYIVLRYALKNDELNGV